ncbi:ribosomal subunit interface protein [Clostridiales bacterium oral taxon 876 str. F0540]|nr:ribosomal subunit interface protein [Clostridiales bacterium oral taxon 876 str. F0540]
MKVNILGKNIEVTEGLRNAIEKKLSRLDKFFEDDQEAFVTVSVQKARQIIEVTIRFNGVLLRSEEANTDMYAAIDIVSDKLERQMVKHKSRLERKYHVNSPLKYQEVAAFQSNDEEKEPSIVRTKRFAIKPMSAEEAVLQMDLLGHDFFVYSNDKSGDVNVVYKRKDGNYGLIEPEF